MQKTVDILDPLSEMLAFSTYGNTKNLVVTAVELKGPMDLDAMKRAVHRALQDFPSFGACLREVRSGIKRRLGWEPRPDLDFPVVISDISDRAPETPVLEAFVEHLSPRLDRCWNLFEELPGESHFVRVAPDHHIIAPVIHHAAADAVTASEFGRRILEEYHEVVTGERHESAGSILSLSIAKKRTIKVRKRKWQDILLSARLALIPFTRGVALPVGTGRQADQRQYQIKRVLSREDTEGIFKSSLASRVAFVDLFAASANLAVDRWNLEHDVPRSLLTSSMTVNMKGRYREVESPNSGAVLFFKSSPQERLDRQHYARLISLDRIKQFRKQMDFQYYENVARLSNSFRILPFRPRRRIVHSFLQKHRVSVATTFVGVIWPKLKNGKPTGDSSLTETGGLEATEVHGLGYKLLSSTQVLIIVYLFRNRLNIVLAASASLFTKEEGGAFLDLLLEILEENVLASP